MKKAILFFFLTAILFQFKAVAQTPGYIIGMTSNGGTGKAGTMFMYDPVSGKDSILINFTNTNGYAPYGNIMQASNGLLYGMTFQGGTGGLGVLFSYNLNTGKDSIIINFIGSNGMYPLGTMMQASDGYLYGTTMQGGAFGDGIIFRYDPVSGKDTILFNFNGTDGMYPVGSLVQAADGKLYGMTWFGGTNNYGVVHRFDPVTYQDTVMVNFDYANNGASPGFDASLISDTNKMLYGMTQQGGFYAGVIYSLNPFTGKDSTLLKFSSGSTGYYPHGGLLMANNGLLYGMTNQSSLNGLMFSYNTITGQDSLLFNFNVSNGSSPDGTPMQATNGLIYGMTYSGGANDSGVIFTYDPITGKDTVILNLNSATGAYPYGDLLEAISTNIIGLDTLNCFGDSGGWAKVLSLRGVVMPVTYLWSNGATTDSIGGLKGGTYSCKITDARGKSISTSFTIYQPIPMNPGTSVSNVCYGDSNGAARVTVTGGTPPFKYKWNTGATIDSISSLKPGKDTCIITDAKGCTATAYFTITQASPFKIDSVVSTPTSCPTCSDGTATVYVSGGVPPGDSAIYFYSWTYGGDSATVHGIPSGYDAVCVTSGYYKCGSTCDSTLVITGIASLSGANKNVSIYPVPSSGMINITMQGQGYGSLHITDELGRVVYSLILDEKQANTSIYANLSAQPDGIYFVHIISTQGAITKKLVIAK